MVDSSLHLKIGYCCLGGGGGGEEGEAVSHDKCLVLKNWFTSTCFPQHETFIPFSQKQRDKTCITLAPFLRF